MLAKIILEEPDVLLRVEFVKLLVTGLSIWQASQEKGDKNLLLAQEMYSNIDSISEIY